MLSCRGWRPVKVGLFPRPSEVRDTVSVRGVDTTLVEMCAAASETPWSLPLAPRPLHCGDFAGDLGLSSEQREFFEALGFLFPKAQ